MHSDIWDVFMCLLMRRELCARPRQICFWLNCPWCEDSSCAMGPAEGLFEMLSSRTSVLWKGRFLQLVCACLIAGVLEEILCDQPSSMRTWYCSITPGCCCTEVGHFSHVNCLPAFVGSNHRAWCNAKLQLPWFKIICIIRNMFFNICTFFPIKPPKCCPTFSHATNFNNISTFHKTCICAFPFSYLAGRIFILAVLSSNYFFLVFTG